MLLNFSSPRFYFTFPRLGVTSLFLTLVLFRRKAPFLFFRLARRLQRSRRTPLSFSFFLIGRHPKFSGAFSLIGQSSWHQDKDFSIRRTHHRSCPFLVKLNEPSTSYPHWIKLSLSFITLFLFWKDPTGPCDHCTVVLWIWSRCLQYWFHPVVTDQPAAQWLYGRSSSHSNQSAFQSNYVANCKCTDNIIHAEKMA